MRKVELTRRQVLATLIGCREELSYIVRSSGELAPRSPHIDRARAGELTKLVIHAVLSLGALPNGAGHYRTEISRAYARGVGTKPHTPTVESVRMVIAVIDDAIAELASDLLAGPQYICSTTSGRV